MAFQVEFTGGYESPLKETYGDPATPAVVKKEREYNDAEDKNVAKNVVYLVNNKIFYDAEGENEVPAEEMANLFIKGATLKNGNEYTLATGYNETDGLVFGGSGGGGSSQDALVLYANEYDENSYFLYKDAAHEVPLTLEEAVAAEFGGARIIVLQNIFDSYGNYECRDLIKAYVSYADGDLKSITAITFKDRDAASYELYTSGS